MLELDIPAKLNLTISNKLLLITNKIKPKNREAR